MFYVNSTKPPFIQTYSSKNQPAHNNYYTQCSLLGKKLRKCLPFNAGLKNHGNTCFMNCVLQCLFHTSPLADFFVTSQFERDMQVIMHQQKFGQGNQTAAATMVATPHNLPQFILTKHFYRLLNSMWRNTYDSNYSQELKQLIGFLNPTFSGTIQNDSHELCVWLLDRLSQELTIKLPSKAAHGESKNQQQSSSSFVEELFQVEFKSTVVCSKCNYKSKKFETDMMLSLPLPQHQTPKQSKPNGAAASKQRRSIYPHLILTNQASIRAITTPEPAASQSDGTLPSKSKFYLSPTHQVNNTIYSNGNPTNTSNSESSYIAPFHVKIGVNIQLTTGSKANRELVKETSPITNNAIDPANLTNTFVLNPNIGDLRR